MLELIYCFVIISGRGPYPAVVDVFIGTRAETIHRGFDFVRFFLLGSEFDSFSVFRFGPFLFLAILMQDDNKLKKRYLTHNLAVYMSYIQKESLQDIQ